MNQRHKPLLFVDSNVLIEGLLADYATAKAIVIFARHKKVDLVTCEQVIAESLFITVMSTLKSIFPLFQFKNRTPIHLDILIRCINNSCMSIQLNQYAAGLERNSSRAMPCPVTNN